MRLFAGTPWDQPPRCERCGELTEVCRCPPAPPPPPTLVPPNRQRARVALEKRARGKVVTVVRGLAGTDNDLPALLSRLKSACGAGGSLQENVLEVQGDHRERISQLLAEIGYRVS